MKNKNGFRYAIELCMGLYVSGLICKVFDAAGKKIVKVIHKS